MGGFIWEKRCLQRPEASDTTGTRITGTFEMVGMGNRNTIYAKQHILLSTNQHSRPTRGHLTISMLQFWDGFLFATIINIYN